VRVAVTGGTGVVGSALVGRLVESGAEVRALHRSQVGRERLASAGAEPVAGDVLDYDSIRSLVDGCERVFHVAGVNEVCSPRPGLMRRVNVEGSRVVMGACRDAGVCRMIHTSSAATIGEERGGTATESTRRRGGYLSHYERSKAEAERVVLGGPGGPDVVAVNPSSVQGPGRATGAGALVLAAARGRLPFAVDADISVVDIDDCARGHLLAAERGEPGERYLLCGATLSMREALRMVSEVVGRDVTPRFVGAGLLKVVGGIVGGAYRLVGRRAPICREAARVMVHGRRCDGGRAARELGLEYTPVEDTLRRTIAWFRESGLLPQSVS